MTFETGGFCLSGVMHLPEARPAAVVIGCHGLMANKNSPKQIDLANRCATLGMAYFRFDHRGCGESEGSFEKDTTLENRVADLMGAYHAVRRELGDDIPVGLFGSSLGGTVSLTAAGRIMPFAIVTLAAPVRSRSIDLPPETPQSLKDEVFQEKMVFDIAATLAGVHHILVIHGSADETVNVDNAHTIYRLSRDPKRLLILDGGDHRVTSSAQQEDYMRETVAWIQKCLSQWS